MCVVCQHFQTSFPLKPLGQLKPNFIWSNLGMGERKFLQMVQVTCSRWRPCLYMVKTLKIFSGTKSLMTLKLVMQHRVLEYYQICSNDDPGFTLTYFMARSNLVPYAFIWEKGKTMDFSAAIVVSDLKLATDDRSGKKILLTSKLCPQGAVCPLPRGHMPVLNHENKLYKIRLQRHLFETCNK